jgi:hypothetical protein
MSLFRTKAVSQVNALIHHHAKGQLRAMKHFIGSNPEHDLLHQVYLAEWTVKKRLEFSIEAFPPGADAIEQFLEMIFVNTTHILYGTKLPQNFIGILSGDLPLINGLESPAAGPSARFKAIMAAHQPGSPAR